MRTKRIDQDTRRHFIRLCLLSEEDKDLHGKEENEERACSSSSNNYVSYGTAGFRCHHAALDLRRRVFPPERTTRTMLLLFTAAGICVTASHNEASDNGLKIVDGHGNVLGEAYEHACEMICNAKTEAQLENALDCFEEKLPFLETSREDAKKTAVVYFGRDTRESGERLVEKAKEGARALGGRSSGVAVKICDRGVVTTPMLHYFVYAHGKAVEAFYENNKQQEEKNDEDATERSLWKKIDAATQELAYFKRLAVGYLSLIEEDEEKKKKGKNVVEGLRANATTLPPLHIDCANGVGFVAFEKLMALFDVIRENSSSSENSRRSATTTTTTTTTKEIALVLKNGPNDGPVNLNCGSDFVQKNQRAPETPSTRLSFVNQRCASVDGDCDRLVYFSIEEGEEEGKEGENSSKKQNFMLCDGDKLSILIAFFLIEQLFLAGLAHKISLGIAHTAYSNGAFTKFCEKNGVETVCAKTGVKNVHKAAEEHFDIGVYFESNGHGTALFSDEAVKVIEKELVDELTRMSVEQHLRKEEEKHIQSVILTTKLKALLTLKATIQTINPAIGDAISSVLLIEGILRKKGNMPFQEWHAMYRDLPTKQTKVKVRDRTVIECFDSERKCLKPEGLQQRIDEILLLDSCVKNNNRRAFVRPSGTEDIVRVYVEASDAETCEKISTKVEEAVIEFCN
ncbi:unnamed protein product [Bathycoccus prasinos]